MIGRWSAAARPFGARTPAFVEVLMLSFVARPVLACAAIALCLDVLSAAEWPSRAGPIRKLEPRAAARASAERSVWDSVYTAAQATRGDSLYRVTCSKCHGATLAGGTTDTGDEAPPLAGPVFLANWNGMSLGEVYEKVRNGMPPDNPKTIDPKVIVDVMAYMMSQNKFPAGASELPVEIDKLREIKIASKP
jgi:S-disulfanyl-L-cysteine oxidoreductase SoxD